MHRETDVLLHLDAAHTGGVRSAVAEALRRAVLEGRWSAGDGVPSSRVLASMLAVSRGSVVAAVDQLVGEGYLVAHPRSGVVVAPALTAHPTVVPRAVDPSSDPVARSVLDLRPGNPSTAGIAGPEWRAAWRAAAAADPPGDAADVRGILALREQIAAQLHRSRGVIASPEEIVVTSATADAVGLVVRAAAQTLGRPVNVVVEDPGYPAVRRRLARLGARLVPVPVRGDGLDLDALERLAAPDVVVLTPSHQYPTGGRLAADARIRLTEWATAHGVVLVEDDYDSEFRHVGAPLPALASLDETGTVVHVGSFSKTVSPWLRIAFVVVRRASVLRAAVDRELRDEVTTVSGPTQLALAGFMASGALRRHLARARRAYAHRRRLLLAFFDDVGWGAVSGLDGGLHAVITFASGVSAEAVVAGLADRGVLVANLDDYAVSGRAVRPGIVLGYGNPGDLDLARALAALDAVVRGIQES